MTSVAEDGDPAIRDRPDLKRKNPFSQSSDPSTAAASDSDSSPPDEIRSKRPRVVAQKEITIKMISNSSIESNSPTIIESVVSEVRRIEQNRLDQLKERLHAWESNGVVSHSYSYSYSFFVVLLPSPFHN